MRRKILATILTITTVPVLAGCAEVLALVSGEVILDSNLIERTIEEGVLDQSGYSVTAECPATMTGIPGDVRQCIVTDQQGTKALVDVTIQNREGYIVWQVKD